MYEGCTSVDHGKIGVFVPLTNSGDPQKYKGLACAALLAIAHANRGDGSVVLSFRQRPPINLSASLYDTRHAPAGGIEALHRARSAGVAAIVGPSRSAVSQPVATLGGYFDLPLVSYTSSADDLTDNARFPTFSRVNPTDLNSAALMVKVIQGFNWSHFSIVHAKDVWGRGFADEVSYRATKCGMPPSRVIGFEHDSNASATYAIKRLAAEDDARERTNIVVLLAFGADLPAIFAAADARGLLDPPYVWIVSWSFQYTAVNAHVRSGRMDMRVAKKLEGVVQTGYTPQGTVGFRRFTAALARLTPAACEEMASELGGLDQATLIETVDHQIPASFAYAFDAATAVSLALWEASAHQGRGDNSKAADFVRGVSFSGATGSVSFGPPFYQCPTCTGEGNRAISSLRIVLQSWRLDDSGSGPLTSRELPLTSHDECNASLSPTEAGEMIWIGGGSERPRDVIEVAEERELARKMKERARRQREHQEREEQHTLTVNLCVGLLVPFLLLLAVGVVLVVCYYRRKGRRKQIVWQCTRKPLRFSHTVPGGKYHLFLSHTWLSGQDQVHLIKRQLSMLAPDMAIFLDVDNLDEFDQLASEIAASDVVLLFLSRGYFASKACAIEYEEACRLRKPIVLVHEGNENKGSKPMMRTHSHRDVSPRHRE